MNEALLLGILAVAVCALIGYPAVSLLRRRNLGKEISEWGPESHMVKAGTPTMGGLFVVAVIAAVTLIFDFFGRYSMMAPLGVLAPLTALGFLDDLGSLKGRRQWALNKRIKFVAFLATGVVAALGLYELLDLRTVNIPWSGRHDLGLLYLPVVLGVVVLTAGGVAVTDGLDGLFGGCAGIAFAGYGVIALLQEQWYIGSFCFIVTGTLLGFLWHNAYPARVFIGDSGALPLGGGLAVVAFMTGQWLVLPLIGVVFLIEGLSDVIQVGYFRLSGGKRVLRMAPLHHHFEHLGWSEVQVVQRFRIVGAVGAALGVVLATKV
ncbi:MAG: phospho-N-acetylmuramoyl-pentapeptide-transferase [Chloroflexi bacterium]|nr:MAG: phospho-N-acetylmuramoyl-pentapeptide-transferase [Chloroflexota bacterium]